MIFILKILVLKVYCMQRFHLQEISWNQEISDKKKELQEKWNGVSR